MPITTLDVSNGKHYIAGNKNALPTAIQSIVSPNIIDIFHALSEDQNPQQFEDGFILEDGSQGEFPDEVDELSRCKGCSEVRNEDAWLKSSVRY